MRIIRHLAAVLGLLALACGSAFAAPAMWSVTGEDSEILLFGSVHVLPPNVEWWSDALEVACLDAEAVYFEADVSPTWKMITAGLLTDGTKLSDYLNGEQEFRLWRTAKANKIPMASLQVQKPWLAAMSFSDMALSRSDISSAQGVESTIEQWFAPEHRRYLENRRIPSRHPRRHVDGSAAAVPFQRVGKCRACR
jgi:uncharacterized protein YbaP (TraB family)